MKPLKQIHQKHMKEGSLGVCVSTTLAFAPSALRLLYNNAGLRAFDAQAVKQ